ncbi:ribonuclease III [Tepidamorphus sp. 3E244]|uniref:ribonuclease III n=1 Tax=Tepidamorphus sp. 3E244 TaxID=3385498 RepID=UPI0038FD3461
MTIDQDAVFEILKHRFKNEALLREALTHASAAGGDARATYQRLEFLGDRVLGLAVADMLQRAFPKADEGELSRRLTQMVRGDTCAKIARKMGIGPHILVGDAELRMGAQKNRGILANVCESVIGAIFLDAGYEAARDFVEVNWNGLMLEPDRPLRDPKTMLQEWAHKAGRGVPNYRTQSRTGPDHAPVFSVEASVDGMAPEVGKGTSKRAAEQAAAEALLVTAGVWEGEEDGDD